VRDVPTQPETMNVRVKGISHYQEAASHCRIGDAVNLVPEPENPHDRNAVRVDCHGRRIGYISRDLAPRIQPLAQQGRVKGVVSDVLGERRDDFSLGIELRLIVGTAGGRVVGTQSDPCTSTNNSGGKLVVVGNALSAEVDLDSLHWLEGETCIAAAITSGIGCVIALPDHGQFIKTTTWADISYDIMGHMTRGLACHWSLPSPFVKLDANSQMIVLTRSNGSVDVILERDKTDLALTGQSIERLRDAKCGSGFVVGLSTDGTLSAWGKNDQGQCETPLGTYQSIAVSSEGDTCAAISTSGRLVTWGKPMLSELPPGTFSSVSLSDSGMSMVALREDGSPVVAGVASTAIDFPSALRMRFAVVSDARALCINTEGTLSLWGASGVSSFVFACHRASPNPNPLPIRSCNERVSWAGFGGFLNQTEGILLTEDGQLKSWGVPPTHELLQCEHLAKIYGSDQMLIGHLPDGSLVTTESADTALQQGIFKKVAVGWGNEVAAIRPDGSVVLCGIDTEDLAVDPSTHLLEDVAIGCYGEVVGILSNGHLVHLTDDIEGNCPKGEFRVVEGTSDCFYAIRTDGSIVHWGGEPDVVPPPGKFQSIAVGGDFCVALGIDGMLTAWGDNDERQCECPSGPFCSVSAGASHAVALREDGSMAAWGDNDEGQCQIHAGRFMSARAIGHLTYLITAPPTPTTIAPPAPKPAKTTNPTSEVHLLVQSVYYAHVIHLGNVAFPQINSTLQITMSPPSSQRLWMMTQDTYTADFYAHEARLFCEQASLIAESALVSPIITPPSERTDQSHWILEVHPEFSEEACSSAAYFACAIKECGPLNWPTRHKSWDAIRKRAHFLAATDEEDQSGIA
jgi:hypothetical protein